MTRHLSYFLLAVSGFSFWFFMAVPFASHRESYIWLASVYRGDFADALGLMGKTWRPLAQVPTWLGFALLDPVVFPTSIARQASLQIGVYLLFALGWWIIYKSVPQPRSFAVIAAIAGAVFFPGYIHLFHIYGLFYVPLMLMLAWMVRSTFRPASGKTEVLAALAAAALTLWHPFGTVIFLAFCFGRYVSAVRSLRLAGHLRYWAIMGSLALAILAVVVFSPNLGESWGYNPFTAFLVSYRTNEINAIASAIAWLLALVTLLTLELDKRWKAALAAGILVVGSAFFLLDVPLLLLWIVVALGKLVRRGEWSLAIALAIVSALPYLGRIGGPIYGLFPIVLAVVVTSLGLNVTEARLRGMSVSYALVLCAALALIVVSVRVGATVPVISRVAKPLLAERERTFQLEHALAWLSKSRYCGYDLAFTEASGNPIDSVESAITRRHRPPSALEDVLVFWEAALRCRASPPTARTPGVATITFDGPDLKDATRVFDVPGPNAGPATVWITSR